MVQAGLVDMGCERKRLSKIICNRVGFVVVYQMVWCALEREKRRLAHR